MANSERGGKERPKAPERLGLCIVGCGRFAARHAEPARQRSDRVELFFASRSIEKAAAYAREYGAADAFGSYEAAAKDPRVHALLFCTPHAHHRANVELAAAYGKHVLMEKPIATTLADAQAMTERARAAGIRFMVGENYRYMPAVMEAAGLLRQGTIGPVRAIHIQATTYVRPTGWRLSYKMMGGGALIDGGIHMVSALRMLGGEPERVSAVTPPKVFPEMEGEEAVSLWLTFPGGAVGTMNFSWAAQGDPGGFACLVVGTDGYISFDFHGSSVEVRSPGGKRTVQLPEDWAGLGALLDAFLALIAHGEPPLSTPEEAAKDLAVVLAAYESAEANGRPVPVTAAG